MLASTSPISLPIPGASAMAEAGGVPVPPTSLLGRERELCEVVALLDRDNLRVVSLLGPGGVGKTRLALEVARRVAAEFVDGAVFVPLDAVRDAQIVPRAIARCLGVRESAENHAESLLAGVLAERHLLLVLDNFEQVVGCAPWIADTLARCPRLRVLVTSRRALNIGGEQQYGLRSLPVPDAATDRTAAVELFIERARAIDLAFKPDAGTIATIAEVCRRLDGLPLAIELAAARIGVLSPQALHARLSHRLTLLATNRGDAPVRLRSMRDAIGWSYELLTPREQRLLSRLATFLGGFSIDAVAYAAAWPESPTADVDAIELLKPLVDQSLVQAAPHAADPRFRMLETIREFGLHASEDDACRMHADYYLALTKPAERALTGPDQAEWLDRLEIEYPNILAALRWLEDHDRLDDAVKLTCRIAFFVTIRGHTIEFHERLERWLASPALAEPGRIRGLALLVLGSLVQNTGDLARSRSLLAEAMALLHDAGDQRYETKAQGILATACESTHDMQQMRELAARALITARSMGDHRSVSTNLDHLAMYALRAGDAIGSRQLRDEALRIAVKHGDIWVQAFHLRDQAAAAWHAGRLDEAERLAGEGMALFDALGSRRDVPGVWLVLALCAHERGDLETAAERIANGIAVSRAIGYTWYVDWLSVTAGIIAAQRGDLRGANEVLTSTLGRIAPGLQPLDAAQCLAGCALISARAGDIAPATRFLAASSRLLRDAGVDLAQPGTHLQMKWADQAARSALSELALEVARTEAESIDVEFTFAEALAYRPAMPEPVQAALPRSFGLSPREAEVLRLMADGLSNQQVSDALYISPRTTATHVTSVLTKLRLPSRTAAVAFAIRNGLA